MNYFKIIGGNKLKGEISIGGAKNAALPMLCASLLSKEKCYFENVPNVTDVRLLLQIFKKMGVQVSADLENHKVEILAKNFDPSVLISCNEVKQMRASVLMIGPIVARYGEVKLARPGGCVIGARSNSTHFYGFEKLGATVKETAEFIQVKFPLKKDQKQNKFLTDKILFSEASVTATENLAMFAAGKNEKIKMYFTAAEPHVISTLEMLKTMGAKISQKNSNSINCEGTENLQGGHFVVPSDSLIAGTYAIASILTQGDVLIKNIEHQDLYSFYGQLQSVGANFKLKKNAIHIFGKQNLQAIPKLQTAIFPGFPTDLQAPFGVLLTQCKGESLIFETLFENRLTYLSELEKMGAKIRIISSHQASIFGPTKLKGETVQSWDLRAGAAMIIAGLIADGETQISDINYIHRGYESFAKNLRSLGADIQEIKK